jgi:hypothetical protein
MAKKKFAIFTIKIYKSPHQILQMVSGYNLCDFVCSATSWFKKANNFSLLHNRG